MPATVLDPRTALVVIDMQKGLAGIPTVHPFEAVLASSAQLARAFRNAGLPVVLVNVMFSADGGDRIRTRAQMPPPALPTGPDFGEILSELEPAPGDIRITKRQWNAFYGTDLDLQLRRRQVTGIVLCGVVTSIGVDSTARAAHERAYNLTFASDAMTDRIAAAHENALTTIFPRMGEIDTTEAILKLLGKP